MSGKEVAYVIAGLFVGAILGWMVAVVSHHHPEGGAVLGAVLGVAAGIGLWRYLRRREDLRAALPLEPH